MVKIAVFLQKGGVGKTSIAGNVAHVCARTRRVVLVDGDPQGNTSSWFLTTAPQHELADVLQGKAKLADALVALNANLSILPTFGLNGTLKLYAEGPLAEEPFIIEDLCGQLEGLGFEVALFDLSPGASRLEKCILLAMDEVITPVLAEGFSMDGLEILAAELEKLNRNYRRNVLHKRIVVNGINRGFSRHLKVLDALQGSAFELYVVPQDSHVAESQFHNQSLFDYAPHSRAAAELERLAFAITGG
jgi:chromosome partitioning protein